MIIVLFFNAGGKKKCLAGTDEAVITEILAHRTIAQRQRIKEAFKQAVGKVRVNKISPPHPNYTKKRRQLQSWKNRCRHISIVVIFFSECKGRLWLCCHGAANVTVNHYCKESRNGYKNRNVNSDNFCHLQGGLSPYAIEVCRAYSFI